MGRRSQRSEARRAGLGIALILAACQGRDQPAKKTAPRLPMKTTARAGLDGFPRAEPLFTIAIPRANPDDGASGAAGDEPAIDHVYAPLALADEVIVGSSAIGCVGIDPATGTIEWTEALDPPTGEPWPRHPGRAAAGGRCPVRQMPCLAVHGRPERGLGSRSVVVDKTTIALSRAGVGIAGARGKWALRFDEEAALGVAGPVLRGDVIGLVRDGLLEGRRVGNGQVMWSGDGRYAWCGRCLGGASDGRFWALSLDRGVARVLISADSGAASPGPDSVGAAVVLDAAFAPGGALVAAVRSASGADSVVAFDAAGKVAWTYSPPGGATGDPPPLAILIAAPRAVLFHGGTSVAVFALP